MVSEYASAAYGPLAADFARLSADRKRATKDLARERQRVRKGFDGVHVVTVQVADLEGLQAGDDVEVRVEASLGELAPKDVLVELVLGTAGRDDQILDPEYAALKPGAKKGKNRIFEGTHRLERSGRFAYGIRVRPAAEGLQAFGDLVLWA
jgi:starch phosphorylase